MKASSVFCSTLNTLNKDPVVCKYCWWLDLFLSHVVNFPLGKLFPCAFWMDWGRDGSVGVEKCGEHPEQKV